MDGKPSLRVRSGGELPLSGESLVGLMRAVLDKGKPFRFEARGTSMHPFIRDGDVVTVVPLAGPDPRPGDVAAFVQPGTSGVRVHRIVKVAAGRYFLKGDNALDADGALARDMILGLVVRLERGGRVRPVGPTFRAAAIARLSRTFWFTRISRCARRLFSRRPGRA
ncbi:MAG: S24/S26 family peptidase [Acidobacteria bacterium]|nr:S24/S26 family peptidase [Acidobacteriota bacterium]